MKKMDTKVRWLLGLSLMVCWLVPAGLRAQGADTVRWTWTAEAGETKTFGFSGAAGTLYVLQWGDGQTTYVTATGGPDQVTHAYAQAGAYDGLLRDGHALDALVASMVYVEGGTFQMGATPEQGSGFDNQKPVHEVELNDFYMGAFEVTQAQWEAVMGTTVAQQRDKVGASMPLYGQGVAYPMYYVSWNEAVAFCEKLSEMTGQRYRLPTEAEWEYAARGGNKVEGTMYAGGNGIDDVAWYNGNSGGTMQAVGQKRPNALGLYDMSGNLSEWNADWYAWDYYGGSPHFNPQGPAAGTVRVYRGGSCFRDASDCRVALRFNGDSDGRYSGLGFRVVRPVLPKAVEELTASMVYVKGGTFSMGATPEQGSDAYDSEKPVHSVTLDGYYIGAFEVTQAQWYAVMGTDPSNFKGDDLPVEKVSRDEAVAFCEKLSEMTGKTYRLPTEAEWEYAARGGHKADGTKYAGSNDIDEVAWYNGNSGDKTHPVGQKKPNGLGIYDMSGNVWEWCQDGFYRDYYSDSPSVNPQGPPSASNRVRRGGSWRGSAQDCRVSNRDYVGSFYRHSYLGFRVVCSLEVKLNKRCGSRQAGR